MSKKQKRKTGRATAANAASPPGGIVRRLIRVQSLTNQAARDPDLSFAAVGVHALLAMAAGTGKYALSAAELAAQVSDADGQPAVQTALDELVERGYARRVPGRDGGVRYMHASIPEASTQGTQVQ